MSTQFPFINRDIFSAQSKPLQQLEDGAFSAILKHATAKRLFARSGDEAESSPAERHLSWPARVKHNAVRLAQNDNEKKTLFLIGLTAFQAFLQLNVTGPPLDFQPAEVCVLGPDPIIAERVQKSLILDLSVDGEAVYSRTPNVELFVLSQILLCDNESAPSSDAQAWARLRVNFWHQKMLNEVSSTLQDAIYKDLAFLEGFVLGTGSSYNVEARSLFLLERVAIHIYHGFDRKAQEDLEQASQMRHFQHVLTGRLGKRTKFQHEDFSQLVVLAKSHMGQGSGNPDSVAAVEDVTSTTEEGSSNKVPGEVELNDDTLLERISFASANTAYESSAQDIPKDLAELDPAAQPILHPVDATILLSIASSITNNSPDHGLTREETAPYAVRVIEGGSSNWQVYTQALLVRSRIEGYKSRTVERGVLQLQALVDQIIAETSGTQSVNGESSATTFLPRAKPSEAAPASERLKYLQQLSTPPRWALEGELAARWASLGGLRTALEIFERLEMWAEAALCLAATDQEGEAVRMVRMQLYEPAEEPSADQAGSAGDKAVPNSGVERSPLPADAPRLLCILGDIENAPEHYERAWVVSHQRYARAQRSLGKHYVARRMLPQADEAYSKAVATNPQNAGTWFALGCVRLETKHWHGAVNAFQRCVNIEHEDAEAWSNLAAALLHLPPDEGSGPPLANNVLDDDDDDENTKPPPRDPQKNARAAFAAFKRAAGFKRDSYRIWQNMLTVGATLTPPPYSDLMIAQTRLIELRGDTEGEGCLDWTVLEGVLAHVISVAAEQPTSRHGLEKMFADLVVRRVQPLLTRSRRGWQLVARLALHERRWAGALDAYERAWRAALNQPGWDDASAAAHPQAGDQRSQAMDGPASPAEAWRDVQEATEELIDAYESLGERETTEGLAAGTGTLVCSNWRFKARSAARAVVGRRTKAGQEDVEKLRARMEELKG